MTNPLEEILKLSLQEKIMAVEAIWDSIAQDADTIPVPEWQKKIIEERLQNYDSASGKTWEEVKAAILRKQ